MRTLITKSTKGNTKGSLTAVLIICFIILLLGFYIFSISNPDPKKDALSFFIPIMMMSFGFGYPVIMILISRTNNKTYINVYDDVVSGVAADGLLRVISFEAKYDQIQNVDVIQKAVIIHTSYCRYSCAAGNASEIKDAILSRKAKILKN